MFLPLEVEAISSSGFELEGKTASMMSSETADIKEEAWLCLFANKTATLSFTRQ